jgi:parallel beta-helix repeat protein
MHTERHDVFPYATIRFKRRRAYLAALAVGAILAAPGPVAGRTLVVGAGLELETITAALDAAEDGDRIEVRPGTYPENLIIEESVEILGSGEPHIIGDATGDVVVALAHDVVLSGFAVSGSGNRMIHSHAGIKLYGHRARITDNRVFDNLFGIYLHGCEQALIENNTITGRAEVDIGRRGAGIHFYDANHNVVRANRVSYVRDGSYFDHADFNLVDATCFAKASAVWRSCIPSGLPSTTIGSSTTARDTTPLACCSKLSKSFGSLQAIDDISFSVAAGETVVLLGPNGSGKTTTLHCAAGLLRPDRGTVRLNGFDLRRHYRRARAQFSFLPQFASFPPQVTVREVLEFHARLRGLTSDRVEAALQLARRHR